MIMWTKVKDPDALLDYQFDWAERMLDGDTITSHDVLVPAGVTKVSSTIDPGATSVTVWLSGGSLGAIYPVVCRITTAAGRSDDWTLNLHILEQ